MPKLIGALMVAFLATSLLGQTAATASRDEMNLGVQAYKNNRYAEAVQHFQNAANLDPSNKNAQLYLATAYLVQWVPGMTSEENKKLYDSAKLAFQEVLDTDPNNSVALASMASLAYNSASVGAPEEKAAALEEAKQWNQRRVDANDKDSDAYYYLGVIAWAQAFPEIQSARVKAGMPASDSGPLTDAAARSELAAKYGDKIQAGLDDLEKCLAIDKQNEDAMSYANLLFREKAFLEDSADAAKADIAQAEDWSNKSLEMKRLKAANAAKPPQQ